MRKTFLIATAITGAAAIALTGCGGRRTTTATEENTSQAVLVKVLPATQEQIAETVDFTANLRGNQEISIIPAVSERIDKIYVEVGDNVKQGQLLVELNKLQYNQYNTQLMNAIQTRDRMIPVFEAGGISQQQIDEINFNITTLQEVVDNYKSNLSFRSPINGVVSARNFENGDLFSMAAGLPLLKIVSIDTINAYVGIPEQHFSLVYIGMPVRVSTDVYPDAEFNGKVSRISPVINPMTRTFEVEVEIPNSSHKLRPGMFARTTFNFGMITGVTVEDLSVQRQPGSNERFIFVIKDGKAERRTVITGRQTDNRIEIISGVEAGELVATAGMSRLSNGTKVEILN